MACSPLSCWLHSPKPVRSRLPTQGATSRFPRTSAGSPYDLPRQSRLAAYFPDSHRAFPSTPQRGGSAAALLFSVAATLAYIAVAAVVHGRVHGTNAGHVALLGARSTDSTARRCSSDTMAYHVTGDTANGSALEATGFCRS